MAPTSLNPRILALPFSEEDRRYGAEVGRRAGYSDEDVSNLWPIIQMESSGDHTRWGGDKNNYFGIVQFGPEERARYGINTENPDLRQQIDATWKFLSDRGYKPGMGLNRMYATVLAGSPRYPARADSNGMSGNLFATLYSRGTKTYNDPDEADAPGGSSSLSPLSLGSLTLTGIVNQINSGGLESAIRTFTDADIERMAASLGPSTEQKARLAELQGQNAASEAAVQRVIGKTAADYLPTKDSEFAKGLPEVRGKIAPGAAVVAQALASFGSALSGNQAYDQGMRQQIAAAEEANAADKQRNYQLMQQEANTRRMMALQFESDRLGRVHAELVQQGATVAAAEAASRRAKVDLEISRNELQAKGDLQSQQLNVELGKSLLAVSGVLLGKDGTATKVKKGSSETGDVITLKDMRDNEEKLFSHWVALSAQKKPDPQAKALILNSLIQNWATYTDQDAAYGPMDRLLAHSSELAASFGLSKEQVDAAINEQFKTSFMSMLQRSISNVDANGRPQELVPGLFAKAVALKDSFGISDDTIERISPGSIRHVPPSSGGGGGSSADNGGWGDASHIWRQAPSSSDKKLSPTEVAAQSMEEKAAAALSAGKRALAAATAEAANTPEGRGMVEAGGSTEAMNAARQQIDDANQAIEDAKLARKLLEKGPPKLVVPAEHTYINMLKSRLNNTKATLEYFADLHRLGYDDPQNKLDDIMAAYQKLLKEYDSYMQTKLPGVQRGGTFGDEYQTPRGVAELDPPPVGPYDSPEYKSWLARQRRNNRRQRGNNR